MHKFGEKLLKNRCLQISWLQKIKPKITSWFIIVQIADIVLVHFLFCGCAGISI